MADDPVMRPLVEPLYLAAIELADLAQLCDELQAMVARVATRDGSLDHGLMVEGQAADLLSQRLGGVSAFLFALASTVPGDVAVDVMKAVRELTLADQARRLSGPVLAPAAVADDGQVTLFGD